MVASRSTAAATGDKVTFTAGWRRRAAIHMTIALTTGPDRPDRPDRPDGLADTCGWRVCR